MKSKTLWLVGAAAVWCAVASTAAAEGTKAADRGTECAVETKGLKGEERERALDACLKDGEGTGTGHSQQNRMKTCNAEAGRKELRGDERRAFMSSCLKNKP